MAKPKFELTAELVKVEPEPVQIPIVHEPVKPQPQMVAPVATSPYIASQPYMVQQPIMQPLPLSVAEPEPEPEIEREAISMKISKTLKKSFHLWCVQQGITMTDAIEAAIKKYLEE